MSLKRLVASALFITLLLRPCSCTQDSVKLISGDVILGVMFSMNSVKDDACGDYDVGKLKDLMAVKWFLSRLNDMNYIRDVRIGLEAYNTCQRTEAAVQSTVRMLEKFHVLSGPSQVNNSAGLLIGLLGPGRTQEAIVVSRFLSSLPSSQRLLQISGSATGAELSDKGLYSNFYRVVPPDSTQVQVLFKLLQQLGWNYISIIYDNDAYGTQAAKELRDLAHTENLCVPMFEALPLDYRSQGFLSTVDRIIDRIKGGSLSIIKGVVFIGSVATAREFTGILAKRVTFVRFIFSEAVGLQTSAVSHTSLGKGALVAAPPYFPLPEFGTFWNNLWTNWTIFSDEVQTNAFLAGYYNSTTSCALSDSVCWRTNRNKLPLITSSTQWLFEYYQVKAAAIFAAILKQLHSQTCVKNSSGVCQELDDMIRNNRGGIQDTLQDATLNLESEFSSVSSVFHGQTTVSFDQQGEIAAGSHHNTSVYDVFNYRECAGGKFCFQQVGRYTVDTRLRLDTERIKGYDESGGTLSWSDLPKAQCMDNKDCLECLPHDIPGEVVFVPGDIYIVAVAPAHDREAQKPLQCGKIRQNAGADFVQSVLFAVEEINKKRAPFTGILGNKTLGVIILNSCYRELVIKDKLIELHKGTLVLPNGRNSSEILPHIAGYVGAFFSTVSIAMYEVLQSLDTRFVLLSPANTSPELSDRHKYPLYLRLTPGHNTQVNALFTLLRELGHQYVQVLYDADDNYSAALKERINTLSTSKAFNVCVVNNIASDSEGQSFYSVLDDLRKNLWAPLVIVALQEQHTEKVMKDILPEMTASDKFLFLGTDAWARNQYLLTVQHSGKLLGSLSMSVELPHDQLFSEYLKKADPLNTPNPWLKYFWEERKKCYFDGSFRRSDKTGQCPSEASELTDGYVQNLWLPFYINAVYAFALGLNSALSEHCKQIYLCDTLTSEQLVQFLKTVHLDLFNNGREVEVFDSNGDGDTGFKLFQISPDSSSSVSGALTYTEVGRYDHNTLILHDKSNLWVYKNLPKTQCPNPNVCNTCFNSSATGAFRSTDNDSTTNQVPLIGMGVAILALLIGIIVLTVVVIRCKRRVKTQSQQSRDAAMQSRPLPPVHCGSSSTAGSCSGSCFAEDNSAGAYEYLRDVDGRPHSMHTYNDRQVSASHSGTSGTSFISTPHASVSQNRYVEPPSASAGDEQFPYDVPKSSPAGQNNQVMPKGESKPISGEGSIPEGSKSACNSGYLTPVAEEVAQSAGSYVDVKAN
ncbi:uncharacterized protein [Littorina saxatilis]|uniref:uncharacterized protein n=1 Tax=Littorina saxatilis TaxID=31220 RepID=UPI0038B43DCD